MWSQGSRDRAARVVQALAQASSIASFAWIAVPVLGAFLGTALAFALGHSWLAAYAAGAATMTLLVVLLLMYPLHPVLRRLFYGFRLTSVEVTLDVDGNGGQHHVRSIAVDARIIRTGVRRIPDRYCCPGPRAHEQSMTHVPRVIEGQARVLGPMYDEAVDSWLYELDLGGPLAAGTNRHIALTHELDFSEVDYEPRLQRTILDPTDRLLLCLRLPASYWPVEAWGEEWLIAERTRNMAVTIDEPHHEIRLEVAKPRFGSAYRIKWAPVDKIGKIDAARSGHTGETVPDIQVVAAR